MTGRPRDPGGADHVARHGPEVGGQADPGMETIGVDLIRLRGMPAAADNIGLRIEANVPSPIPTQTGMPCLR